MSSVYRGESRPRRQPSRHHITTFAGTHQEHHPTDPFPPLSSKQFPAMYQRNPIRNQYQKYMRAKSPYRRMR